MTGFIVGRAILLRAYGIQPHCGKGIRGQDGLIDRDRVGYRTLGLGIQE